MTINELEYEITRCKATIERCLAKHRPQGLKVANAYLRELQRRRRAVYFDKMKDDFPRPGKPNLDFVNCRGE